MAQTPNICFGERASAGFTPFIAALDHFSWIKTEQELMEVVSITTRERPRQHDNPVDAGGKRAEDIALGRVSAQLMHFIANIAADEIQRGDPTDLVSIRLPKRAVQRSPRPGIR